MCALASLFVGHLQRAPASGVNTFGFCGNPPFETEIIQLVIREPLGLPS